MSTHPPPATPGTAEPVHRPRLRRTRRVLVAVVLGLAGGWAGLSLGGTVHHEVGPLTTSMRVHVSWGGGSTVTVPPLGRLDLDTHGGPLGVAVRLEGVDGPEARNLVEHPSLLDGVERAAADDVRWELEMALLRGLLAAGLGAAVLSFLAQRRLGSTVVAACTTTVAVLVSYGVGAATWNPAAIEEPTYTGLLSSAPSVVGSADDIVSDFSVYSDELARLVHNVSSLYTVTSALPILPSQAGLVRVLHVSDLHLAPQAWDVIRTVTKQYHIDVVVDSGDITDHGTSAENRYLQEIRHLDVPYVWVRGNHDSMTTQRAMQRLGHVVVLDGRERTVAGLRFLGAGDPAFTPDKTGSGQDAAAVAATARDLATTAERDGDVDIAVYHDPAPVGVLDGDASMVLSGHLHYRRVHRTATGTWMMVEGSTGGSGLRALEPKTPSRIQLSVLYVDRASGALRAYDDIALGGLGLASAQINRHVVDGSAAGAQLVGPRSCLAGPAAPGEPDAPGAGATCR